MPCPGRIADWCWAHGRIVARQPLSKWAKANPVAPPEDDERRELQRRLLLRRAAGGPQFEGGAPSYSVKIRMPKPQSSPAPAKDRYYTLIWDSADVLGFEQTQARARVWRRSTVDGRPYNGEAPPDMDKGASSGSEVRRITPSIFWRHFSLIERLALF